MGVWNKVFAAGYDRFMAGSELVTVERWQRRHAVRRWLQNIARLTDTLI